MTSLARRRFLKIAGAAAAPLGLGSALAGARRMEPAGAAQDTPAPASPRIRKYNTLGRTGLKIPDIGFGGINYFNPDVARYAYDCGVTFFDTAEGYGQSERMLGEALAGVRDKVVIATKHLLTTPEMTTTEAMIRRVEESLKRLRTDYVDVALIHAVDDPAPLRREELLTAYDRLKASGKVRFSGFSTHQPANTLGEALASGRFDVVLMTYNHLESAAAEPLIAKARAAGIGTVAMKVFAGGKQGSLRSLAGEREKYSRAAMRWVLGNPAIDGLIITMSTFSHVEDYVANSGMALRRGDLAALERYREEAGPLYCRVSCDACLSACPDGVAVNQVLRFAMYYTDYGMAAVGLEKYAELDDARKPRRCDGCEAPCETACPFGLRVRERLTGARALLSP